MQSVIYLFVSPSGRAYAGKHECKHAAFPRRGHGALPSGYRGSGTLWAKVTRRHGPAIRWIILRRFGDDAARADIDAAERRAIRLVRAIWADRCLNVFAGGGGITSADASALWTDPVYAGRVIQAINSPAVQSKKSVAQKAAWKLPEVRARIKGAQKAAWSSPEARARQSAASKEVQARPEVRAQSSASHKALAKTPERRAQLDRARDVAARKRRARRALAPFAVPPSIAAPGVCLWAFLPALRLSIAGPKGPARRR